MFRGIRVEGLKACRDVQGLVLTDGFPFPSFKVQDYGSYGLGIWFGNW